jgi:hypothetical protein
MKTRGDNPLARGETPDGNMISDELNRRMTGEGVVVGGPSPKNLEGKALALFARDGLGGTFTSSILSVLLYTFFSSFELLPGQTIFLHQQDSECLSKRLQKNLLG